MPVPTITWENDSLRLIDQTFLPERYVRIDCGDVEAVAEAIESLRVRGAPAIGVAAAYGVVVGAGEALASGADIVSGAREAIARLSRTRPTAVNLFWALERMGRRLDEVAHQQAATAIRDRLLQEAHEIFEEDRRVCRQIGKNGAELLNHNATVLTHCNAGALATADYGTALAVVYAAVEAGKQVAVFADETRPLLQGSRLTAWELRQSGVDVTVICDSMAASVLRQKNIDSVIVGADRIAANGDVANKIGTLRAGHPGKGTQRSPLRRGPAFHYRYVPLPRGGNSHRRTRAGRNHPRHGQANRPGRRQRLQSGLRRHAPAAGLGHVTEKGVAQSPYGPTFRAWFQGE